MMSAWKLNLLMEKHGIQKIEQSQSDDMREIILTAWYENGEVREAHFSPMTTHWKEVKFLPVTALEAKS